MGSAVNAVIGVIQSGIDVARIEFTDAATARAFNIYAKMDLPEVPHLLLEFHGSPSRRGRGGRAGGRGDPRFRRRRIPVVGGTRTSATRCGSFGTTPITPAWRCRPGARAVVTDICVPVSRLAEAVEATAADIEATGLIGPILGHVGDGNFHAMLLVDTADPAEIARAKACAGRMAERALAMGGTITGEHGIGVGKRGLMAAEHGARLGADGNASSGRWIPAT